MTANPQKTILIIEDDKKIIELISQQIQDLGMEHQCAEDGETGLRMAMEEDYALIVLDLMLPRLGGLEVCRRLREHKETIPILMLTARSGDVETVLGLELGADEYMTKPFRVMEFRARVRALLRRVQALEKTRSTLDGNGLLVRHELELDLDKRRITLRGEPLELSATQYSLLTTLATQPGRVFSREELLEAAGSYEGDIYVETINCHISRLRAKIEANPMDPTYIKTVRGIGYRFADLEELESLGS